MYAQFIVVFTPPVTDWTIDAQ